MPGDTSHVPAAATRSCPATVTWPEHGPNGSIPRCTNTQVPRFSSLLVFAMAALSALALTFLASTLALASPAPSKRTDAFPDYVFTYAPYTHLWSQETWWPADIATHVQHVVPEADFAAVAASVTLEDLSTFASSVYLTSIDNVEDNPAWLLNAAGTPDASGIAARRRRSSSQRKTMV